MWAGRPHAMSAQAPTTTRGQPCIGSHRRGAATLRVRDGTIAMARGLTAGAGIATVAGMIGQTSPSSSALAADPAITCRPQYGKVPVPKLDVGDFTMTTPEWVKPAVWRAHDGGRRRIGVAVRWCHQASDHARSHSGKPWTYVLIPHDAIAGNMTLDGLAKNYAGR